MASYSPASCVTVTYRRHLLPTAWQRTRYCTGVLKNLTKSADFGYAGNVNADLSGIISGTVMDGSTPVQNCLVVIFGRATKRPVFSAKTNSSGVFSITGVPKNTPVSSFFAIAFPTDTQSYNALIFDKITPA